MTRTRRGITAVELMVLTALFAVFTGLFVPAVVNARAKAVDVKCMNNLKQLGLAIQNFADSNGQKLPVIRDVGAAQNATTPTTFGLQSVHFRLLPYIEQDHLYKLYSPEAEAKAAVPAYCGIFPKDDPRVVPVFLCPVDPTGSNGKKQWAVKFTGAGAGTAYMTATSYAVNGLAFGQEKPVFPQTFQDGTSNTFIFAERYQECNGVPSLWAAGNTLFPDGGGKEYGSAPAVLYAPAAGDGVVTTGQYMPGSPAELDKAGQVLVFQGTSKDGPGSGPGTVEMPLPPFQVGPAEKGLIPTAKAPDGKGCDPSRPQSAHDKLMFVAMADGSVRGVKPGISPLSFYSAATPAGQETGGLDD